MSSDPASSGDMGDVNLGLSPIISGMSDSLLAGTNFPPAGSRPPSYGDPILVLRFRITAYPDFSNDHAPCAEDGIT